MNVHSRLYDASEVVKVPNGHWSQMADGHLGQAQMADVVSVGHLGLGSNFQLSLKWLMAYLKVCV